MNQKQANTLITIISIIIPLVVAALFKIKVDGFDLSFLPPIYATINGITAILLVLAVRAIKNKNRILHERLVKTCIFLSLAFLIMYVAYHITSDSTVYGRDGFIRYVYLFILISHIVLSIVVIPLVLFTYHRAASGEFDRHKKLSKITFPIWLYVAITGVIVYIMISPYYT